MTEAEEQQPEENKPEDAKDNLDEQDNDEGLKLDSPVFQFEA